MLEITQVETARHRQHVEDLIAELSAWDTQMSQSVGLDTDLLLSSLYNHSVAEQIAECAPPAGRMLLVSSDGQVGGCAGIRPLSPEICELKRLYVRPSMRGKGAGKALVEALIAEARQIGYATMRLETASFMKDAHRIYYALGFQDIPPYVELPEAIMPFEIFMELDLGGR